MSDELKPAAWLQRVKSRPHFVRGIYERPRTHEEIQFAELGGDEFVKLYDEFQVAKLQSELAAKQAKIDALMLEYCPDEMTEEQFVEWSKHQTVADAVAGGRKLLAAMTPEELAEIVK